MEAAVRKFIFNNQLGRRKNFITVYEYYQLFQVSGNSRMEEFCHKPYCSTDVSELWEDVTRVNSLAHF